MTHTETAARSVEAMGAFQERIPYLACPLCDSPDIGPERTADCSQYPSWRPPLSATMTWMRCGSCDHSFTDGYYTEQALAVLFDHTHASQSPSADIESHRSLSAPIVDRVSKIVRTGKWLDVGFGNGSLLFTAQEYGFEAVGVDLREEPVRKILAHGISAAQGDLTAAENHAPFDVISMADVLEHTPFPKVELERAHAMLKDHGVLFVSLPNAETRLWSKMSAQDANPYWGEMEHYHNFKRSTLYSILEEKGFSPTDYSISHRYRLGMEVISTKGIANLFLFD